MLKHFPKWASNSAVLSPHPTTFYCSHTPLAYSCPPSSSSSSSSGYSEIRIKRAFGTTCSARRRVIYEDDDDEECSYNEELAMLEMYTQLVKDEILLVEALVDEEQVDIVIFKGFSSCLSYKTSSDPSRSVLPANAVIKTIDRAKGPFDPSNVEYIEKGLTFDTFKTRLSTKN